MFKQAHIDILRLHECLWVRCVYVDQGGIDQIIRYFQVFALFLDFWCFEAPSYTGKLSRTRWTTN